MGIEILKVQEIRRYDARSNTVVELCACKTEKVIVSMNGISLQLIVYLNESQIRELLNSIHMAYVRVGLCYYRQFIKTGFL